MKWIRPRAWVYLWPIVLIAGVLLGNNPDTERAARSWPATTVRAIYLQAVDLNPDPNIFETNLVAQEAEVDLGNGLIARARRSMAPSPARNSD